MLQPTEQTLQTDQHDPTPKIQEMEEFSYQERRMLKYACMNSHLVYTRFFFKKREGSRFMVSPHHKVMANVLDVTLRGGSLCGHKVNRLIINVPPGYTKTEMAVVNYISHGMAINPASRFIHVSYSDQLALLNSATVKDVVMGEDYQSMWPMELREDSQSKKAWYNKWRGGMMAVASGGSITGFRAGRMMEGFSGALVIDDPIKPDDAYSETMREKINTRFTNTFKSRLAHEDIPIIVIMQRVHEDDPTGFLLKGGTGEMWHHLCLPVDTPETPEKYPTEFSHGIPIPHNLKPGPLWPYKHNAEQIEIMRDADPYTYASQYDQRPAPLGGGIFKDIWWKFYDVLPNVEWKIITADTAQKEKEHNDYSVFQCWGMYEGNIYLIDQLRGKWIAPTLKINFIAFWNKHYVGGNPTKGRLRCAYVEDKVSGTGLIQDIINDPSTPIPMTAVQRNTDKITRAMDMVTYIASGYVHLPKNAEWLSEYLSEFAKFTPTMTHKHDDQIDPTLDAIAHMLRPAQFEAGIWGNPFKTTGE